VNVTDEGQTSDDVPIIMLSSCIATRTTRR